MYCNVLTASKSKGIGSGLTYETEKELLPGAAVRVPLRNKIVEGVVLAMEAKAPEYDCKSVIEAIEAAPLLTDAQIRTAKWMSQYYFCSLRQALGLWLPSPWQQLLPRKKKYYSLRNADAPVRGKKQIAIIECLQDNRKVEESELLSEANANKTSLQLLVKKQIVSSVTEIDSEFSILNSMSSIASASEDQFSISRPTLTNQQQSAYKIIKKSKKPTLLFGVTGSGKTEIYAQLIADTIREGKQAILLVPEILLTENSLQRFYQLLDKQHIAVIHSKLTPAQKRSEWKRIHNGEARLILGSRSALFSPAKDLGLVVIDEEHEWTYKNEQTPRYNTRDVAEKLCEYSGAQLVLGSATPSLESWSKSQDSTYTVARLDARYGNASMPAVRIVDLGDVQFGNVYPFSPTLLDAIDERLQKHEQSVLFLNRRGMATSLLCMECRRRIVSPETQLPLTVHQNRNDQQYLLDHSTGSVMQVPDKCPSCQSVNLRPVGAGTQKIEHILRSKFPKARIARADRDTLMHPEQMRELLSDMQNHQVDILLGTQSVVKGLDIPGVTLAAVILADVGMSLPHFRAGERSFQLLSQLTGRSGRHKPGEVIIQTFRPEALEVQCAANHDVQAYIESEQKMRMHTKYPPSTSMIRLLIREDAESRANKIVSVLEKYADEDSQFVSAAPGLFTGGKTWNVFLRGTDVDQLLDHVDLSNVVVDRDPVECL